MTTMIALLVLLALHVLWSAKAFPVLYPKTYSALCIVVISFALCFMVTI